MTVDQSPRRSAWPTRVTPVVQQVDRKPSPNWEVTHEIDENTMEMRMLLGLKFFFSEEALQVFGAEIDSLADLEPVDLTTPFYKKGMRNLVGTDVAEKLEADLGLMGTYRGTRG